MNDTGNILIAGSTVNALFGPALGSRDSFIVSLDSSGSQNWSRQFGSVDFDTSLGVDSNTSGGSFLVGDTFGSVGGPSAGSIDGFIVKHDAAGQPGWSAQIGSTQIDSIVGVAAGSGGGVYVAGQTNGNLTQPVGGSRDGFVSRYDASGNQLWISQFGGAAFERPNAIAVDDLGNSYTAGFISSAPFPFDLDTVDTLLVKHDSAGNLDWSVTLGSSLMDQATAVAIDPTGGVYITGTTKGVLAPGGNGGGDVFLAKYDSDGNNLWTRQYGSNENEVPFSIAADQFGNAYIAGSVRDNPNGGPVGDTDPFLAAYSPEGNLLWDFVNVDPLLTESYNGVDIDSFGNIYTAGLRSPAFSSSIREPYAAKFAVVPEPSSLLLISITAIVWGTSGGLRRRLAA